MIVCILSYDGSNALARVLRLRLKPLTKVTGKTKTGYMARAVGDLQNNAQAVM